MTDHLAGNKLAQRVWQVQLGEEWLDRYRVGASDFQQPYFSSTVSPSAEIADEPALAIRKL